MFHADTLGTAAVLERVRRFERRFGPTYWTPAPLLRELGEAGESFQSWQDRRAAPRGGA
jgi:3-hydroxyacyl-CoA dehydrogenase